MASTSTYARVNTSDMRPWAPENIAIVTDIPGVISTSVEGVDDCCLCIEVSSDIVLAKSIIKCIAKAFPNHPITWTPTPPS